MTLLLGSAAVLAGSALSGCATSRAPSSLSGLESQIARGERVSAASRAHATPAGTAAATTGPAQPVPGRMVTAVGDSVMAASAMALQAAMPGIYIDAKPDREMPAGLAILRRLARAGRLRPVVVVGLGTNYLVTTAQLSELMQILGPARRLVLINTYVPDSWSKQVNATEAAFIQEHPSVVPADWYDTIRNRMYLLWPDHVHPEIPGTLVYARMVYRAVQATRNAPPPGPAPVVMPLAHPHAAAGGLGG